MSEQPIKLFAKTSERYPESDEADRANASARILVSMVPVLGSPINELLSLVLTPSLTRRKDEWLKELADMVDQLQEKVADFQIEDLTRNEAFVSATIQATRVAIATHKQEKRHILRNALLNIALGKGPDEDTQQIFLNIVDVFTASHVRVLDVLWRGAAEIAKRKLWDQSGIPMTHRNYGAAIELLVPELKGQSALIEFILTDLRGRGLSQLNGLGTSFPQGGTMTNMGTQFLRFVIHPDELQ